MITICLYEGILNYHYTIVNLKAIYCRKINFYWRYKLFDQILQAIEKQNGYWIVNVGKNVHTRKHILSNHIKKAITIIFVPLITSIIKAVQLTGSTGCCIVVGGVKAG